MDIWENSGNKSEYTLCNLHWNIFESGVLWSITWVIIFFSMKYMIVITWQWPLVMFHACYCFSEKFVGESVARLMISHDHTSYTNCNIWRNAAIKVSLTVTTPGSHQTGVKRCLKNEKCIMRQSSCQIYLNTL